MQVFFTRRVYWVLLTLTLATSAEGQLRDSLLSEQIAVLARPSPDSITLRFAPLTYAVWMSGNEAGYRVERILISRNGMVLSAPEKTTLATSLKPWPEAQWEKLVASSHFAAIAAQALFGETFTLDLAQTDIFRIVDKVRENEQRFTFALFSADMNPAVAEASGLWLVDRDVRVGDKYLYRVTANTTELVRGSIFTGPGEPYLLAKPANLTLDIKRHTVSLRWDKTVHSPFTAYVVERSEDGRSFRKISDTPLVTVSPAEDSADRYVYGIDSLEDLTKTYHYRVRGITPFGEEGPPSEAMEGKASPDVGHAPHILSVASIDNRTMVIQWDFPAASDVAIEGFRVDRAAAPGRKYQTLNAGLLNPGTRRYHDYSPGPSNYYRIIAIGKDGEHHTSHDSFAHLIDSIPPAEPTGLRAQVDDDGNLNLSWNSNSESDLLGYRVYRAYHQAEEFALVTESPISTAKYSDTLDLNTLNKNIYYRVMAIDQNQNHSVLSSFLKVPLPDKVRPQPPVLLPVVRDQNGIVLSWVPAASADIARYQVYRRTPAEDAWQQTGNAVAGPGPLISYLDSTAVPGVANHYTVVSIDSAGLESVPAYPVTATPERKLPPAIAWNKPVLDGDKNQLTLSWTYDRDKIESYLIFRAIGNEPIVHFANVAGNRTAYTDTIVPGKTYTYRVMVKFTGGDKSRLSEALVFEY